MPADGQAHPTSPNLIYDAEQRKWVPRPGVTASATTAPKIGDIDYETAPNGDIIIKVWNGKYWEIDDIRAPGDTPSGSAPSYSSTQAYQEAQNAFDAEQDRIDREWRAEQAAILAEEGKRKNLLDTATRLLEGRQEVRGKAREQRVQLAGLDPFRFTAALHQVDAGDTATAYDQQKAQLANITNNPLPTLNASGSTAELQATVDKLNQMEAQENNYAPNPLAPGMAGGGTLPGPTFGGVGYGVLVGDGTMNGDEEVVVNRPDGSTEIIPLRGRAAEGAVLPLPNMTAFPSLFENLRNKMFSTYGGGPLGSRPNASDVKANFDALGFSQPLGQPRPGTQNQPMFGEGLGALYAPLSIEKGLLEAGTDAATAKAMSAQIGILPNPRNAARFLSRLAPAERQAVIGLYRLAGIQEDDFDLLLQSASAPAGQQRQSLSYG